MQFSNARPHFRLEFRLIRCSQKEMAEKGGKGFSLPKGSLKGKDDNSAKSKQGRKVQIDFEDVSDPLEPNSPKTNGKVNTPISKGDSGKGGKASKAASGGKNSVTKAPSPEFKIEEELPKNVKCLMDCEAAEILQGIQDRMVVISADPSIKIPISSFDSGLTYAKRGGTFSNPQSVRKILEPLIKYGVSEGEMCMVANLKVESDDEVFALVPSLKSEEGKLRDPLKTALNELAKIQSSV
ncbi:DNA-directed RNA polymerases IV and V subunit 4 isoform X3 [Coffea arabica]|uniref:DNA-directed RNA polymerases IV and V subunit 4 isoform X3 n=1 Tax=Coffea arabica TaxID=13443 RepID=A0ABM4VM04_COFAR